MGIGASHDDSIDIDSNNELGGDSRDGYNGSNAGDSEDDEVQVSKIWPGEFLTSDIVEGFKAIADFVKHGATIEDAFQFQFGGVQYVATTYRDHCRRWKSASQAAKDKALTPGRTSLGLWSEFMASNPAPYGPRKAALKRVRRAQQSVEPSEEGSCGSQ